MTQKSTATINDTSEISKKSAISGEYVISQDTDGSVVVYKIFNNVRQSLREASDEVGVKYDPDWNTRYHGKTLCKEYGDGKSAAVGHYYINVLGSGSIETYRTYDNTKDALREISKQVGFKYDESWGTRAFGSKLIDYLNGNR